MSLASFEDANNHLDQEKVKFATADDASDIAESIDRYVRGKIAPLYGDAILLWDIDPTLPQVATPELIREITSMLMAAKLYAEKYSLEDDTANTYASRLKRDAEMMLEQLIDGSLVLIDAEGEIVLSGVAFSQDDFWPNELTGLDTCLREPKFAMDDQL